MNHPFRKIIYLYYIYIKVQVLQVLFILIINSSALCQKIEISPRFVSLQLGQSFQLTTNSNTNEISWSTNNQNILISKSGLLTSFNAEGIKPQKGIVRITNSANLKLDSIPVTLVNWCSNKSKLVDIESYANLLYLGHKNDTIFSYNYYTAPQILWSVKDLKNPKILSSFHRINSSSYATSLNNQFGHLIKDSINISFTRNYKDWNLVYKTRTSSFRNSICQYLDSIQNKIYFFTGDYHTIDSLPISIYRGEITSSNIEVKPIYTFPSRKQYIQDPQLYPQARHIHTITVDPYTNDIWVGTGDDDRESFLMFSQDNGNKWQILGTGSQDWRTLCIWFSPNFVYWAMDSGKNQKVFRIPRSKYRANNTWPAITPLLSSGNTKPGIKYFIKKKGTSLDLVEKEGNFYTESKTRQILGSELIPINDIIFDYKEIVAELSNSALWFGINVLDDKLDNIMLLSTDAEGKVLDDYSRVFGIKERSDGSLDVQEVLSILSTDKYSQLSPLFQNSEKSIFYWGYYTDWKLHKMELYWNDNSKSIGGVVKENPNIVKTKEVVRLVLQDYDGSIIKWQKSKSPINWIDIIYNLDTLTVEQEKGVTYYRAIVKKNDQPPVSAIPITINTSLISGISNKSIKNNNLSVGPNPVKYYINISGSNQIDDILIFELFSIDGKLLSRRPLYTYSNNINEIINMPNIPNGIYIIKIKGNKSFFVQKIIIQK